MLDRHLASPSLLAALLLLGGCTSLFEAQTPYGCEAPEDEDMDGFLRPACLPSGSPLADCDDTNPDIHPGATEACNGIDDSCDGRVDENLLATAYYPDCDGDGAGAPGPIAASCDVTTLDLDVCDGGTVTWVARNGDCDDADDAVGPGATEVCNGIDDDCDFRVDEELTATAYYIDCDGDGHGNAEVVMASCDAALLSDADCDGSPGAWVDLGDDCDDSDPNRVASCGSCGTVDLLFVVDNTAGSTPMQTLLTAQLPALVAALATGDVDADGTIDTEPLDSFHLGVVTTDMGFSSSTGTPPGSCSEYGDDGILRDYHGGDLVGCDRSFPAFLQFDPSADPATVAADFTCLATTGEFGCDYEQPLEASLRALTPAASPIRFHGIELGHGDLYNRGFLTEGSILALTVLANEDDCSVGDYGSFFPFFPDDLNCVQYDYALHPLARYASGLLALRSAEELVYTVVGGVPTDLTRAAPTDADYETILSDTRMIPTEILIGGEMPALQTSCTSSDGESVIATPPARLVDLGWELTARGARTVVGSVCGADLSATRTAMLDAIFAARDERCATETP